MRYVLNKPLKFVKQYETGLLFCILTHCPVFYVIHLFENWEVSEQRCWICKEPTLNACRCYPDVKRKFAGKWLHAVDRDLKRFNDPAI